MSKYKKIFSGLGLLSISTLIGAGVVACAKTKVEKEETPAPGTSDSKDLATIKNEASVEVEKLQGHEKYTELKAIIDKENATIEELNSAKTSAIEELNKYKEGVQTAIEAIADNAKKEELKKEIETANSYNDLKTIKDKIESKSSPDAKPKNDGKENPNQGKNEDSTGKDNNGKTEQEKGKENEGGSTTPKDGKEETPPKVTVEEKATALIAEIEKNPGYPSKTAPALKKLKDEVENIKKEINKTNDEKLASLVTFETKLNKIKEALEKVTKDIDVLKYPNVSLTKGKETSAKEKFKEKLNSLTEIDDILKVLPNGWANKIEKYNEVFTIIKGFINVDNLNKRFAQTDDSISGGFTEKALIWNVYETVRKNFETKVNKIFGEKRKSEAKDFIKKFEIINQNNHNKTIDWLLEQTKKIVDEFPKAQEKAKNTANKPKTPSEKQS
ncbi:hypothetical protein RRG53_02065 [Mycoplasmopsis cynos]|uniref:hypothetical protein n=1 Tax=Mycoplasmopsis cynos TaxID=171284 RepID=UPI002AFDFCE9|nr:hypothetical protein [Mycoplasmopsis cynos]WQQ18829.1 hypothetical protein RRG53_02065 [Mycoplasmopsis cynos]